MRSEYNLPLQIDEREVYNFVRHGKIPLPEAEFMNVQFHWGFGFIEFSDLKFVSTFNVYLTNQFHTTIAQSEGGGVNSLVEVTANSREENSQDSCTNYVQEFGLRTCAAGQQYLYTKGRGAREDWVN